MKLYLGDRHGNLGVKRGHMPQIYSGDVRDFLAWLKAKGVRYRTTTIDPKKLRPTQSNFNKEKVLGMMDNFSEIRSKPILVSKDNRVLDGHHRWLAFYNLGEKMPVRVIGADMVELLRLARKYPNSSKKSINEAFDVSENQYVKEAVKEAEKAGFTSGALYYLANGEFRSRMEANTLAMSVWTGLKKYYLRVLEDDFTRYEIKREFEPFSPAKIMKKLLDMRTSRKFSPSVEKILKVPSLPRVIATMIKQVPNMQLTRKPKSTPKDTNVSTAPTPSVVVPSIKSSNTAKKIATDIFKVISDKIMKEIRDGTNVSLTSIEKVSKGGKPASFIKRYYPEFSTLRRYGFFEFQSDGTIVVKKNIKILLTKYTRDVIERIKEDFVTKFSSKMARIVERKGGAEKFSVKNAYISYGRINIRVDMNFNDGSKFTASIQAVTKSSSAFGYSTMQYHFRFHDVYFADGSKMKQPSEAKVLKDF